VQLEQGAHGARRDEPATGAFDRPQAPVADFGAERRQGERAARIEQRDGLHEGKRLVGVPVGRRWTQPDPRQPVALDIVIDL